MAEEKQQKSAAQTAQTAAGKAKDAAKLAMDIGRIAAGDLSAIKDVLKNKLFWEIILVFAVTISLVGMIIGGAITGVINYISQSWSENWDENWTNQAIESGGNIEQLQTTGWLLAFGETVVDVAKDLFDGITSGAILMGKGSSDNSQIGDPDIEAAGRNPQDSDFQTTMEAIQSSPALSKALTDRLDMIKGRVVQRGLQIKKQVYSQYIDGKHSVYSDIAEILTDELDEAYQRGEDDTVYFYAGFDESLSQENIHFDTSVFELSDLQALKILAIFCVQQDCQLTEMDIWTLMDYCGWYNNLYTGSLDDMPDSIYETTSETHLFGSAIGSVTEKNMPILNWEFDALEVPVWTGTCAPQWYYEELAQIRNDPSLSSVTPEQLEKINSYKTFGIIDKLFYSAENNLTVNRKEYSSTNNYTKSEIEALGSGKISKYWKKYIWARSKSTFRGTVTRDDYGEHIYTYSGSLPSDSYTSKTDEKTGETTTTSVYYSLYLTGGSYHTSGNSRTWDNLTGDTRYTLYRKKITVTKVYDKDGKLLDSSSKSSSTRIEKFTTFEDRMEANAYELYLTVNLSFKARSVDEIAFDLLGIWPGDLTDTVQVVRTTMEGNLVGQSTKNETKYSYCLKGGTVDIATIPEFKELADAGLLPETKFYMPLMRPTSSTSTSLPLTTEKMSFEYGITGSSSPITDPNDKPIGGWRSVDANYDTLVFDISGNMRYLVYARVTYTKDVLNSNGTVTSSKEQYVFLIDEIRPGQSSSSYVADTPVKDDTLYANGHLGDEGLRLTWTDTLTQNGTSTTLTFNRQSGYQYESYVDMVMALCERLEIDYTGWEPALERAEELGLRKPA